MTVFFHVQCIHNFTFFVVQLQIHTHIGNLS